MSFKTRLLSTQDSEHPASGIPSLTLFNRYDAQRYPYLLLSSAARQNNTQFDILIACPQYLLTLNADRTLSCTDEQITLSSGFFDSLEKLYQDDKAEVSSNEHGLPFTGGWFVYLSYEMAEEIEPCLSLPALPEGQPLAVAARCPAAIIHDKNNNRLLAIAEEGHEQLLDELEQDYLKIISQADAVAKTEQESTDIALETLIEDDARP